MGWLGWFQTSSYELDDRVFEPSSTNCVSLGAGCTAVGRLVHTLSSINWDTPMLKTKKRHGKSNTALNLVVATNIGDT